MAAAEGLAAMGLVMPMDLIIGIAGALVAAIAVGICAYLVGDIDGQNK